MSADILNECASIGLLVERLDIDGQWHRCPVEGKRRSNLAGAYCLRELMLRNGARVTVGVAHNWVSGAQKVFDLEGSGEMSAEDQLQARAAIKAAQDKARIERETLQEETAARAKTIFYGLPDAGRSPYLDRKKVRAWGVRFSRGSVVVPLRDASGKLWGLQFIKPDGEKKFLTGTAKKGRFHLLGDPCHSEKLLIAEGYATAATLYQAFEERFAVAVAFDAGNLLAVAQTLFTMCAPKRIQVVICADNDAATPGNPGLTKAREAADAVGGRVVWPRFDA